MKQKTVWLALFALASVIAAAEAADLSAEQGTSSELSEPSETKEPPRFSVDAGFGGSNYRWLGGFAAVTYAPFTGGLDQSGPRFRLDSGYGSFYYFQNQTAQLGQAPSTIIDGRYLSLSTLVGYAYVSDDLSASGFVGANYQYSGLSLSDTSNPTAGSRGGVVFSGDADYRPIKSWSIMTVDAYSTANYSWFSIVGAGYEVSPNVFLGPEVAFSGNEFSHRFSAGGRLRGLKVGAVTVAVAGGFQNDSKIGAGGYGALQFSAPFQ